MRNKRDNDGRVSKRSSTGIRRDASAEKREPIRSFGEADELYGDVGRRADRYDDRRADRDEDRRNDRYDDRPRRDDRYRSDRREDRYYRDDRRGDDRYYDDRRAERYYDDRRDDRRRDDREEREYDDLRRISRREAPRWDEYRFDEDEAPRARNGRYNAPEERSAPRERREVRRSAPRRVGGDTELFVHQIVPYVMFWIALFAAVSFILRDLVSNSAGAFGSWLADALGGLMGPIAYLIPLWLVVLSIRWKRFVREGVLIKKLLLSAVFLWLLAGIIHVFQDGVAREILLTEGLYTSGAALQSGGVFGGFLGEWMGYVLYLWGTILLAIPLLLIIGIYMIGMTPSGIWQRISYKLKKSSEHRAERRRALYDGEEQRTLRVKGKQPEQLQEGEKVTEEGSARYDFPEEDDFTPTRHYENKLKVEIEDATDEAPAVEQKAEGFAAEAKEPASRVQFSADIVDIPDDLPEIDEPIDDLQTILNRAGHTESAEEKLDQILREATERVTVETTAPVAEEPKPEPAVSKPEPVAAPVEEPVQERVLQGTSYSPFALHQHFEPKRETPDASVAPVRESVAPVREPVITASAPAAAQVTEESLGSETPARREPRPVAEPIAAAPVPEISVSRPVATVVAESAPVAEAPRVSSLLSELIVETETVEESAPAPAVREEPARSVGGFSFADDGEKDGPAEASAPRSGFAFADEEEEPAPVSAVREEPVAVPAVREAVPAEPAPVAPQPRPATAPRTVVMPPKAQVLTKVEPVKDEKPTPPPPPREYRLPHIELLKEDTSVKENDHSDEIQEKIDILRTTLKSFNIRVKDEVSCSRGPTITRYELRPEPGVSVRSVMNRADDISLNMAAPVRIEAPIPGKPAIGIEVPNSEREMVFMRTLLESELYKNSKKPLEVPLGLDVGGDIIMCDLAKMPHLLVAGSTGSGKSVCINTILISLMYKTSPNDLRLILIDPKQVEFTSYNHIPHLYAPIVTDSARALGVLACAVQEMERRYSLIKDVGVRNIEGYNEVTKNDPEREHLPYMVIVIDEFADLKMACSNNDVEAFTCRLAQKARAAGMHLIIGTQRPTVSVITGNLKNNIPSRIAFKVTQQTDSRTILDANGAEQLIGRGDMLYMTAGLPKPARMQGAFVSDEEVERVATYVRDHNDDVQYNQAFMDQIEAEMARAANTGKDEDFDDFDDDDDEDPKFREAVELAIETQKVATSLLQRRLGVGYGRAAKIIDRMEALGYVSAPEGNKARKVLVTHAEFAAKMMEGEEGEAY